MASNRLLRSTAVIGAFTGLSRVLGFAREILMAYYFGTSLAKSAFDVAFRFPNLFRRLFGEGALSAAFVPVFTEAHEKEGLASANRLASRVMTMLAAALMMIVLGGVVVATLLLKYGGLSMRWVAVMSLLRVMLPYMVFICLVALCMGILNSFHRFALPAATPIILNVVWIAVLIWLCPRLGRAPAERIYGVAMGVVAAGALQLLIQFPLLMKLGIRPRIACSWDDPHVRRILKLMGPATLGMGVHQVNVCLDGVLALWAAEWAPAALTYAERLIYFPLGVFATAMGTVLLPTFSRQAARKSYDDIRSTLAFATDNLMLVMIPAAVGLIVLAAPIVQLSFEWGGGEFGADSTVQTVRALWCYAPGLVVFSLYKVIVPAFYAMQDTRTPVKVGIGCVLLNLVLNVLFVVTWPVGYKHAGLALATVLASGVNGGCLAVILTRRIGSPGWGRLAMNALRAALAAAAMGVAVHYLHGMLSLRLEATGWPSKVAQVTAVTGAILGGMGVYAAAVIVFARRAVGRLLRRKR